MAMKPERDVLALALLPSLVTGLNAPRTPNQEAARALVQDAFAWADAIIETWPQSTYNLGSIK